MSLVFDSHYITKDSFNLKVLSMCALVLRVPNNAVIIESDISKKQLEKIN